MSIPVQVPTRCGRGGHSCMQWLLPVEYQTLSQHGRLQGPGSVQQASLCPSNSGVSSYPSQPLLIPWGQELGSQKWFCPLIPQLSSGYTANEQQDPAVSLTHKSHIQMTGRNVTHSVFLSISVKWKVVCFFKPGAIKCLGQDKGLGWDILIS